MTDNRVIKIFDNIDDLSGFFCELLVSQLNTISRDDFFSIALSGGSTPKAIFGYLAKNCGEKIPWERINFFWGDERCVSHDNDDSNYKMANDCLLSLVPVSETNVYGIIGEDDPELESQRYGELIKKKIRSYNGIPQFDLVMLGLGEDGHTASIFPDKLHLIETNKLYAATQNPYNKQYRITATGKLINNASRIVFLVTGSSKSEIVKAIINQENSSEQFPASYINPLDGDIYWLLDSAAASRLGNLK
jgi:6-phosphogluconolactonase